MKLIIKIGDISNTTRNTQQAKLWAYYYINELQYPILKEEYYNSFYINKLSDTTNYNFNYIGTT